MTPLVPVVLVVVFVLGPLARALASRISRDPRPLPGAPPEEVARLRDEVDRLGAEVTRLSEEQAFMLKLLASGEKPQGGQGPSQAG
ncbi:MAG TPA: hypothetical protein VF615_00800 [Longimicrobiaceae bacterium]|jgi:ABC-type uncharacterized transport system substrate-binding protein